MTQKSRPALKTQRKETIYKNPNNEIDGGKHADFEDNILDSYVNYITDKLKLNLREFSTSLQYDSGIGVLSGGKLYQANKNTGPGPFVAVDWDEISGGGTGGGIFLGQWVGGTSYALGEYVVNTNNLYECTTANSDAVFTPGNWSLKVEGNIVQTAATTGLTVDNPADWNINPTQVKQAVDELASRMSTLENTNFSNNVAYVSKQGSDTIGEYELGNPGKPFLTIQAAANALPSNNAKLIVDGGGTYTENVTLKSSSTNCVFDFGNCVINGDFRAQFNPVTNNCMISKLNVIGATNFDIRSTFLSQVLADTSTFFICLSKFVSRCIINSSTNVSTVRTQGLNESKYWDTVSIINTGTGNGIDRSSYTILNNCFVVANTGDAINNEASATTIQQIIQVYNSRVKSAGFCVEGENGLTNLLAYNTIFYSSGSDVISQGGNTLFGTLLNFENCKFYATGSNDILRMNGTVGSPVIDRTATENYTFENCLFYTETGFPVREPDAYVGTDAGTTLLVNCRYNAATVTPAGAGTKVTDFNPLQFTNYTNFNPLQ